MAAYLPLDVIVNHILIRLSERSLISCRCVCKEWLQILTGSDFRRIHLQHQISDSRLCQRFICGPLKHKNGFRICDESEEHKKTVSACGGVFYSLDLASPSPTLYRLPGFQVHDIGNCRLVKALGYINGMICMEARISTTRMRCPHLFFGNPLTGFYKILTEPLVNGPFIVGFGYDKSADDFKFVRVDKITRHPHIYSLKKNSWTINHQAFDEHKIGVELCNQYWKDCMLVGTFVDGSVYWFSDETKILIGFNLKDEIFTELPVPDCRYGRTTLTVFQGSLCMIKTHAHSFGEIDVVMCWMKRKGNKYIWIELIKLRNITAKYIYPLGYMNGGVLCFEEHDEHDLALWRTSRYILVDPQTSRIQDIHISGNNNGLLSDFVFQSQFPGYIDTYNFP